MLKQFIRKIFELYIDYVNSLQTTRERMWRKFKYHFRMLPVRIKNWFICLKYPWLAVNSRVYPWLDSKYDKIWIDCMPYGWKKRFGWDLVHDIHVHLKKHNIKDYHIEQVKEKWGELRWYDNSGSDFYENVFKKYEQLSRKTCVNCGEQATLISSGWICPYCANCAKEIQSKNPNKKFVQI